MPGTVYGSHIWKGDARRAGRGGRRAVRRRDSRAPGRRSRETGAAADPTARPDDNRFTPVVLVPPGELDEPMAFAVTRSGKVYIIERKGAFKAYDPATKTTKLIAEIPVNTKYTNAAGVPREAEEGLVGLTLDPNFEKNGWVYMLYADPAVAKHVLARWDLEKTTCWTMSPRRCCSSTGVQREQCCHTGGGMAWDAQGNLFITVGNNTSNSTGRADRRAARPGQLGRSARRGEHQRPARKDPAHSSRARRHLHDSQGQPVSAGNAGTRPEIYTMGLRNRVARVDRQQDRLHLLGRSRSGCERGHRARTARLRRAEPGEGAGLLRVAVLHRREPARIPYFDYAKDTPLAPKDPKKPINASVNNTGLRELPPAQPAFIAYPYGASEKFPRARQRRALAQSAGRSSAARISRRAARRSPSITRASGSPPTSRAAGSWRSRWTTTARYESMERFLPSYRPSEMIDIKFGPEGDLYVLDYGSTWFAKSADSQLVRIEYNGGNRDPIGVGRRGSNRRHPALQGRVLVGRQQRSRRGSARLRVDHRVSGGRRAARLQAGQSDGGVRQERARMRRP